MKKIISTLAFLFISVTAFNAHAGVYVAPRVSFAKQMTTGALFTAENTFEAGTEFDFNASMFNGSIALGNDFYSNNIPVRVEAEFGYFAKANIADSNDFANAGNKVKTIVANVYYDINRAGSTIPYVNLGLGVAIHKAFVEILGEDFDGDTIVSPAVNLGLGVSQRLNDKLMLEVGYRFSYLGMPEDLTYGIGVTTPYFMNQFMAGLRVNF